MSPTASRPPTPAADAASTALQVRVTAIVVRDGALLLVRQRMDDGRLWSLPGGRADSGETLAAACAREVREETGFEVAVDELLYLAERADARA